MDKEINAAVFPYDFEFLPVIKNKNLLKNINIKTLISPRGFGIEGKDANYFNDDEKYGFSIKTGFCENDFKEIDAVWFTESIDKLDFDDVKKIIKKIAVNNKEIIYTPNTNYLYDEEFCSLCKENSVNVLKSCDFLKEFNLIDSNNVEFKYISSNLDIPVIAVMGMSPMTQKFDVQLYLREKLIENDYKVAQVGTKSLCETMGFYSIPNWFFSNEYGEVDKIRLFQQFLKEIEVKEKPDVIIVGIPDCIMPFTQIHTFNYGIYAFEILNAVKPDFTVLSLLDGEYNDKFYEEMTKLCDYKFNTEIDAFFISKYRTVSNSLDTLKLVFTHTEGTKNESDKFNVINADDLKTDKLFDNIIECLSMYSEFEVF